MEEDGKARKEENKREKRSTGREEEEINVCIYNRKEKYNRN